MRNEMFASPGWLAGLLLAALLGGCQTASINEATAARVNAQAKTAGESGISATGVVGMRDYHVGPLDLLEVEVFGLTDLRREVRVSASGEISLPLTGAIQAGGLTIGELQTRIAKQLSEHYLENPQVSVFVKEYLSQRVTIEGAVRTPGVFPLTGRTSLLQIVAMSGGLDREANPKGVVIYRSVEDRRRAAIFDIRKIRSGELVDPEVLANDVVVVDYSGLRSSLRDFLQATPLLAVFVAVL